MMATDTIAWSSRRWEQGVLRHRGCGQRALAADRVEPADLARRATSTVRAGQRALVDLALEGIDKSCRRA